MIVSFLTSWLAHILVVVGGLSMLISFWVYRIPVVSGYSPWLKYGGGLVLVVGLYILGSSANEEKWQRRILEAEMRAEQAELKAKAQNVVVREVVVEKTRLVKEKGNEVIHFVDKIIAGDTKIIEKELSEQERKEFKHKIEELEKNLKECPVPTLILEIHNEAATPVRGIKP